MIALYSYRTNNIGDDFQSYVMRNYLEVETDYINRDEAASYDGPQLELISNAFMTKQSLPISTKISPSFVAVWLGPLVLKDPKNVEFLKQHAPIGCRDTATHERCQELEIDSYFSGCPTILCKPIPRKSVVPGSILFVDVNPALFETGNPAYQKQTNLPQPVTWTTNVVDFNLTLHQRWAECRKRHLLMTKSELIVTNRIHVAIPALGMGRAVIFVEEGIGIPGRLTALPDSLRKYSLRDCHKVSFDPNDHYYDIENYRQNVEEKLIEKCGRLLEPF